MLFVKTSVRPSTIEGLGLFAAEDIPAGAIIAQYDARFGWSCSEEERASLPPIAQAFLWRYGWRGVDGRWLMDVDDSRFMNHSSTPNMRVTTECGFTSYAARAIAAGEELTEDYRQFDPDFDEYAKSWTTKGSAAVTAPGVAGMLPDAMLPDAMTVSRLAGEWQGEWPTA